jgi:ADP-heptose:LPS heptosyltransferase
MAHTSSKTILIIQTAFIGDTILASHFAAAVKA